MIEICNLRKGKPTNLWDFRVDRFSALGNPFKADSERQRDFVCQRYEGWFSKVSGNNADVVAYLEQILAAHQKYGKIRLFCWCVPKRCHAETIKRYLEEKIGC